MRVHENGWNGWIDTVSQVINGMYGGSDMTEMAGAKENE